MNSSAMINNYIQIVEKFAQYEAPYNMFMNFQVKTGEIHLKKLKVRVSIIRKFLREDKYDEAMDMLYKMSNQESTMFFLFVASKVDLGIVLDMVEESKDKNEINEGEYLTDMNVLRDIHRAKEKVCYNE